MSSDQDFASSLGSVRSTFQTQRSRGEEPSAAVAPQEGAAVLEPVRSAEGAVSIDQLKPGTAKPTDSLFRTDRDSSPSVKVFRLETEGPTKPVAFVADMDIDADGAGGAWKRDRTGQSETSLKYSNGESLDPGRLPFVVIPLDFPKKFKDVGLGDYSAVSFKGKTVYGIVGDFGPRGVLGEASISMAASLGIDPDPNRGGTENPVTYVLFPGTRDPEPSRDPQAIQQRGAQIMQEHGLNLK
ncbi:MAG: glycoside hydrolase family 75 protein [Elusimicrobiota bacterium]